MPLELDTAGERYPSVPANTTHLTLNTGAHIPVVGLGTWQAKPGEVAAAVETALRAGYRHLDCAWAYDNEREVGQGIKASGVPRSDIFLTTKLWGTFHRDPAANLDESLSRLGVDYVDLWLMHWPIAIPSGEGKIPTNPDGSRKTDKERHFTDTWKDMEKIFGDGSGKVRAIGMSNLSAPRLEELLQTAKVVPAANQVELHPYLPQHDLVKLCQSHGIVPQAYSPLGSTNSPLLQEPVIVKIAQAHGVQPAQIIISWGAQRGVTVLPKSITPARIEANAKLIHLTPEEMKSVNELSSQEGKKRRFIKPQWGDWDLKFDDWE